MKKSLGLLTAGELAKLHQINKRTLHYYDEVGVFSPKIKGENGYRYYHLEQTMELENVLYLREMGMSIEEIKKYIKSPNSAEFMALANNKIEEINKKIDQLKSMKADFMHKKEMLLACENIYHGKIEIVELPKRHFLLSEMPISFQSSDQFISNSPTILEHLRKAWALSYYRRSCGSYIALDKVYLKNFKTYDGIFSRIDKKEKTYPRPKGKYLRGFCVGDWDEVPKIYEKMLQFAKENKLVLLGYAFESGINEFVINSEAEYITQIEIFCEQEDERL